MGTLRHALVVVTVLAVRAHADTDIEQADKLFAEGLALRDTNLAQSCEKFSKSLQLNPQAIGTLMNVALCDEKLGRIASAWKHFSEARDRAKEGNLPEYQTEAQSHIEKLAPDLPYVEIKPVGWRPERTTHKVLIGDLVISIDKINANEKVPVDPGEVIVVVSAAGYLTHESKPMLINKKETKTVEIPPLEKSVTVKSSRRTIGKVTTITGGVFVAGGIVIGLVARKQYNGVFGSNATDCNKATHVCPADKQGDTESAITLGWVGTFVGAAGIAATGVGLYLWLTAPKESSNAERRGVSVVPMVTPETAGLTAVGRF